MIHMYTVIPFSTRSLTSTQNSTANNDKVTCDAKQQLGPHPTKNAASSSSSSSLYSPLICPDLLPMIQCRLLLHLSPMPSQIPTFHLPPDSRRSIHVEIIFSFNLTFLTHSKNDNWQTKWFSIFDHSCQDNHRLKAQRHHRNRSTPEISLKI